MFFNVEDERYHGVQERTHDDYNWQDYLLWGIRKLVRESLKKKYKRLILLTPLLFLGQQS